MVIKTITCHDVFNYGASLQAYALMYYLRQSGHDVEIIDYKPYYLNRVYNFWYIPTNSRLYKYGQKSHILHFLISLLFIPRNFQNWQRIIPFKKFKRNFLICTKQYNSYNKLKTDPPSADCYIAGSDQIWNSKLPNGKDPAFYLNFGPKNTKRLSYAASFGISQIDNDKIQQIKQYLKNINRISVREESGLKILKQLNITGMEVVDPVFLLKKEEWYKLANLSKIKVKEKYILVYDIFNDDANLRDNAIKYSKSKDTKIIAINDKQKLKYANINISNAGPLEFIYLIKNAQYVFSCSFHATAFSIIFNKPFAVYYNKTNISRMKDLLEKLNIKECLNDTLDTSFFNWNDINKNLKKEIEKSELFLKTNLLQTNE